MPRRPAGQEGSGRSLGRAGAAKKDRSARVGKNQSRPRGSGGGWNRPNYAAIVIDDKTGQVLHEANADAPRHPASVTKVMTLYLLFEQLEAGHLKLDTPLPCRRYAASRPPTKLGLKPGQTLKVEDALKGLVTRSANDAASVIAEALGGSEEDFARLMTRKAIALGMSNTIYVNASGLPADLQITTARDQALLGRAIQHRFPDYFGYFGINELHLSRQGDRQPQRAPRQRQGRGRHQDRLHPGLRLQPRLLGEARRQADRRGGARRQVGRRP